MALTFSVPDTELSLTLHNRRAMIVDNIFKGTPFLNWMARTGGVDVDSQGGIEIIRGLRYSKNLAATVGSFAGQDTLDRTANDVLTSARYPWANLFATVTVAWDEQTRNAGAARLINLVNQRIDDAEVSLRDELNLQLTQNPLTSGTAADKDAISIKELIDSDTAFAQPSRAFSIGNINQNTETWWRNIATTQSGFSNAALITIFNTISDGQDFPTFIMASQTGYEAYEGQLTAQIRYMDTATADSGFQALAFKNTPMMWDPALTGGTPTNPFYFINTNYLKLLIHAEAQFVTTDFIEPADEAAKTAKILWMGNLTCDNRRRQGVNFFT